MRKGLPRAVTLAGISFRAAAHASKVSKLAARPARLILFYTFLLVPALAAAQGVSSTRRLTPLRASSIPGGSRVTITSDASLDDYSAFREANRFHVVIPQTELSAVADGLRGQGFTDVLVERRGQDVDISFTLQPGATATVAQKFNRLDVTFSLPVASDSVTDSVAGAATAALVSSTKETGALRATGEKVSLPASPAPSPSPSPEAETKPAAPVKTSAAPVASGGIPPEKAGAIRLVRFDKPPTIDGKLDEEVWQQAAVFKDFIQFRPGDNIAPSKPTEVLVGYDARFMYIAFRAHDEPGKVRATIPKRDQVFDDDTVGVYLDTFNDRRRSYVLVFNPLGVQADGIFTEGNGEDYSLDIVMESKGVVTDDGYTVEVAIPFKSLRYEAGKDKLWGVHFVRQIKRLDNETDSWMPIKRDVSGLLSQAGHMTGLEGISTEHTLEVIPSLTISETGRRVGSFNSTPLGATDPGRIVNQPIDIDPGVTLKYGITPTVTLDLALNPDFAQVEADQTVVTANQRFPIFFSEKRPFFLEGIDIFQTPLTPVHTRAIVDPDVAVKLSGKRGRNSFGLMLASDNGPGNLSPDDRGALVSCIERRRLDPTVTCNDERFVDKNAYIGVLRLKHDLGKGENTIGMLATTYNFIEKHNQLLAFDGRFRFDKQSVAQFQIIGTSSRRYFFDSLDGRSNYRTGNAFAYFARYDKDGRNFGWNYDARGFTKDYRADVGFTRRTNTNRHGVFVYYNTDPKPKATLIRQHYHYLPDVQFDWQGRLQSWGQELQTELGFKNQTYMGLGASFNYERIYEEEFGTSRNAPCITALSNRCTQAFFGESSQRSTHRNNIYGYAGTTPSKKYSLNMFTIYNWGAFDYDFGGGRRFPRVSPAALADPDAPLDPGPGNNWHLDAGFAYQPTNELRLTLDYTKDRLVRQDTGRVAFDENIFALRGTYQFTRFTFARARVDYDTLASSVRGQFLLGWTPNPGTSFYVGYNDDLNYNGYGPFSGRLEPGFRRNGRTFFIKMSYLFRRSF